jgi:hypothetical protein
MSARPHTPELAATAKPVYPESDVDLGSPLAEVKEALQFFDVLAPDHFITFQGLLESPEAKSARPQRRTARIAHGRLEELVTRLLAWSQAGCGVFWMVNRGDGAGRAAKNVKQVRAVFVDLDGAPIEPVQSWAFAPHAVVETSAGRWHAYWKVIDCSFDEFAELQTALIKHFNGDQTVKDLPRLMRVPGFANLKGQPFRARLTALHRDAPYSVADLRQALDLPRVMRIPSTEENTSGQRSTEEHRGHDVFPPATPDRLVQSLIRGEVWRQFLPARGGQRNLCVFNLARWLRGVESSLPESVWRPLVRAWHAAALPHIRTEDFAETWADFCHAYRKVRAPGNAYFDKAVAMASKRPLPAGIERLNYGSRAKHLCRLVASLHDIQTEELGTDVLFLSSRKAAEVIGGDHTAAAKMLSCLVQDGVLGVVERDPARRRATRYRYLWGQETQEPHGSRSCVPGAS